MDFELKRVKKQMQRQTNKTRMVILGSLLQGMFDKVSTSLPPPPLQNNNSHSQQSSEPVNRKSRIDLQCILLEDDRQEEELQEYHLAEKVSRAVPLLGYHPPRQKEIANARIRKL